MALIYGVDYRFVDLAMSDFNLPIRCEALERPEIKYTRVNPDRRQCTSTATFIRYRAFKGYQGSRFYCAEHLIIPVLRWH